MADPLALLGDAFANFGANYAQRHFQNEREDKLRRQQLDDQARARQMQLDDRTHSETRADALLAAHQTRENELYNQRKYDAIKAQLVKDRLLDPSDESIEGFAAALKSRGPDYERNVSELAQLKAHAIALIEQSKGDATELNAIFTLGPDQIDTARKLMSTAAAALSIRLQSDDDLKLKNQKAAGAALAAANTAISVANQRIEQLNEESDRITSGALRPEEVAEVRKQAMSLPELAGLKETDLMKPSNQALVQAALVKAEQNFRVMRSFQVKEALKTATNQQRNAAVQMEAITQAARTGLPIDFTAVTGDAAAPAAKQGGGATAATGTTKAAGSADVAAFLAGDKPSAAKPEAKGAAKSTPPAAPAPVSALAITGDPAESPQFVDPNPQAARVRRNEAVADGIRALGYSIPNLARGTVSFLTPSNWKSFGDGIIPDAAVYMPVEDDTATRIQQLESRLAAQTIKDSPTAVNLRNEIIALRARLAQMRERAAAQPPAALAPEPAANPGYVYKGPLSEAPPWARH